MWRWCRLDRAVGRTGGDQVIEAGLPDEPHHGVTWSRASGSTTILRRVKLSVTLCYAKGGTRNERKSAFGLSDFGDLGVQSRSVMVQNHP